MGLTFWEQNSKLSHTSEYSVAGLDSEVNLRPVRVGTATTGSTGFFMPEGLSIKHCLSGYWLCLGSYRAYGKVKHPQSTLRQPDYVLNV